MALPSRDANSPCGVSLGSVSPIPSATGGFRAENPQICVYRLRTPRWWLCPSAVPSRRNRCSSSSNPWVPRVPWFSLKRFPANLSGVCDKGKFLGITSNVKILMRRGFGGWQKLPLLALEMDLMISVPLLLRNEHLTQERLDRPDTFNKIRPVFLQMYLKSFKPFNVL